MRDTQPAATGVGLDPAMVGDAQTTSMPQARRLDIQIDFAAGSRFACPICGAADCPAYDTEQDLAPSQLLPTPGLPARPRATRALHQVRDQDGQCAMGAAGQRLHPAVRGAADEP